MLLFLVLAYAKLVNRIQREQLVPNRHAADQSDERHRLLFVEFNRRQQRQRVLGPVLERHIVIVGRLLFVHRRDPLETGQLVDLDLDRFLEHQIRHNAILPIDKIERLHVGGRMLGFFLVVRGHDSRCALELLGWLRRREGDALQAPFVESAVELDGGVAEAFEDRFRFDREPVGRRELSRADERHRFAGVINRDAGDRFLLDVVGDFLDARQGDERDDAVAVGGRFLLAEFEILGAFVLGFRRRLGEGKMACAEREAPVDELDFLASDRGYDVQIGFLAFLGLGFVLFVLVARHGWLKGMGEQ